MLFYPLQLQLMINMWLLFLENIKEEHVLHIVDIGYATLVMSFKISLWFR